MKIKTICLATSILFSFIVSPIAKTYASEDLSCHRINNGDAGLLNSKGKNILGWYGSGGYRRCTDTLSQLNKSGYACAERATGSKLSYDLINIKGDSILSRTGRGDPKSRCFDAKRQIEQNGIACAEFKSGSRSRYELIDKHGDTYKRFDSKSDCLQYSNKL